MTSPLREAAAARIRAATAQITATAEARLADLVAGPAGSGRRTRAQRAAEQAARREVWAWRAGEIARVTAAIRAETRAVEDAESRRRSQSHRAATRARIARARSDRAVRHTEHALYEQQERSL